MPYNGGDPDQNPNDCHRALFAQPALASASGQRDWSVVAGDHTVAQNASDAGPSPTRVLAGRYVRVRSRCFFSASRHATHVVASTLMLQSRFAAAVTAGFELAYHTCEGNVDCAVGECGASAAQAAAIRVWSVRSLANLIRGVQSGVWSTAASEEPESK
jgi:hypothetical protein